MRYFDCASQVFRISASHEGPFTHVLVQEDVGNNFDVRVWMARPRVVGRDAPSKRPDASGCFIGLKPNCQYRLDVVTGTRREDSPVAARASPAAVGGLIRGMAALHDDMPLMEDRAYHGASCSCLWGNPCVSQYNCKDWANRAEVARRNGWKG